MKPFFRFFFSILLLTLLTSCSNEASTKKVAQHNNPVFETSLPEMISQYNDAMANYSQLLLLPSSMNFIKTSFPHNKFYNLKYRARRNIHIEIEVDTVTNTPISIGETVAGYSANDLKDFFAQTIAIGHAVFKNSEKSRILFDVCSEMLSKKLPMRIAIQDGYMFSCVREDNVLHALLSKKNVPQKADKHK